MKWLAALLIAMPAYAIEGGIGYSVFHAERVESDWHMRVQTSGSAYLFGSYSNANFRMVGQEMGSIKQYGAGFGFQRGITKRLELSIEGGWYVPKTNSNEGIVFEAVWRRQANLHGPVPFIPAHADHSIRPDFGVRASIRYAITQHLGARFSYLALKQGEEVKLCNQANITNGKCDAIEAIAGKGFMWISDFSSNFGAVEMTLTYRL